VTDPLRPAAESPESAAGARTPAGPRDAQARWLAEFERAQLARQSVQQHAQQRAAPSTPPAAAPEAAARARNGEPLADLQAQAAKGERLPPQRAQGAQSAPALRPDVAAQARAGQAQGPAAGAEARVTREPITRAAPPPAPPQNGKPVPVTWPKVNAHAQWNGSGIEVWIRDASLDQASRQRLVARLRAQLGRLDRLTVNGEDIISREEGTSWPSKR
jgi:hypothetical protein